MDSTSLGPKILDPSCDNRRVSRAAYFSLAVSTTAPRLTAAHQVNTEACADERSQAPENCVASEHAAQDKNDEEQFLSYCSTG